MLPKNLIYVRHGESERNLAGRHAFESGDQSFFSEILTRPSSLAFLSSDGQQQAILTGRWLKEQGFNFGRWYTSSYNRAKETAGLLDLPGAEWFIDNNIRERSGGVMDDMNFEERKAYLEGIKSRGYELDIFNFRADRGESFADVSLRWQLFLDTLHRECSQMDAVCVVNHGDNMWLARYTHERWTTAEFAERRGERSHGKMPNCVVLHYTRVNPETGQEQSYPGWLRITCPWQDPAPGEWMPIERKRYSSVDLLLQIRDSRDFFKKAS